MTFCRPISVMQPTKQLFRTMSSLAGSENYLFTSSDLRAVLPTLTPSAFKALLSRAVKLGFLKRVCRGLYLYEQVNYSRGLVLFHAAARLRASCFNYISLETALSEAGVISQIPINWVTIMTSGRSSVISCGDWGHIEFIHTCKQPAAVLDELSYDSRCRLWRASVTLALQDMKTSHRNMDLINWEIANELTRSTRD